MRGTLFLTLLLCACGTDTASFPWEAYSDADQPTLPEAEDLLITIDETYGSGEGLTQKEWSRILKTEIPNRLFPQHTRIHAKELFATIASRNAFSSLFEKNREITNSQIGNFLIESYGFNSQTIAEMGLERPIYTFWTTVSIGLLIGEASAMPVPDIAKEIWAYNYELDPDSVATKVMILLDTFKGHGEPFGTLSLLFERQEEVPQFAFPPGYVEKTYNDRGALFLAKHLGALDKDNLEKSLKRHLKNSIKIAALLGDSSGNINTSEWRAYLEILWTARYLHSMGEMETYSDSLRGIKRLFFRWRYGKKISLREAIQILIKRLKSVLND